MPLTTKPSRAITLSLTAIPFVFALACTSADPATGDTCDGAKCDTPGGDSVAKCEKQCEDKGIDCLVDCMFTEALGQCEARKNDTLNSAQRGLTRDAIRWAAADVDGVNQNSGDDRGQEYTEYFAIVQAPPKSEGGAMVDPVLVGKNTGQDRDTGATTTTPLEVELSEDQLFWLEDHPSEVVGQCVFTSWHADVPAPLCARPEGCAKITAFRSDESHAYCAENAGYCDALPGFGLDAEHTVGRHTRNGFRELVEPLFRMVVGFNSNGAASSLVADCGVVPENEFSEEDLIEDDFVRGCMLTGPSVRDPSTGDFVNVPGSITGFGTQWRRSDSSICAATMRLHECGCGVDTNGDGKADITDPGELGTALIPAQPQGGQITLRGFPLGTWSGFVLGDPSTSQLPANCRYGDTGDGSQAIVQCDLTASDMISNAGDLKGTCREKYGDNVVVHVPIPAAAVVCEPNTSKKFTDNCGDMPWVIGAETAPTE